MKPILKTAYYDVPVAQETFLTPNKKLLYSTAVAGKNKTTLNRTDVDQFMEGQDPYTLHHKVVRNFKRNHYYANNIDHIWECDLCDMSMLAKANDNYKYLLTVIDVLSKFAWVEPIMNKSAIATMKAFQNIFSCPVRVTIFDSNSLKQRHCSNVRWSSRSIRHSKIKCSGTLQCAARTSAATSMYSKTWSDHTTTPAIPRLVCVRMT